MSFQQQPLPTIGVDMCALAIITKDEYAKTTTYGEPDILLGLTSVKFSANSSPSTFYADNGSYASSIQTGEQKLEVTNANLTPEAMAKYLGGKYENGVYLPSGAKHPDAAVGYRVMKSDGLYRYFWFFKGKISTPDMQADTKGDKVNYQTSTFTFSAVKRLADGEVYVMLDDDDPNLPESITPKEIATNWFKSPNWAVDTVMKITTP